MVFGIPAKLKFDGPEIVADVGSRGCVRIPGVVPLVAFTAVIPAIPYVSFAVYQDYGERLSVQVSIEEPLDDILTPVGVVFVFERQNDEAFGVRVEAANPPIHSLVGVPHQRIGLNAGRQRRERS